MAGQCHGLIQQPARRIGNCATGTGADSSEKPVGHPSATYPRDPPNIHIMHHRSHCEGNTPDGPDRRRRRARPHARRRHRRHRVTAHHRQADQGQLGHEPGHQEQSLKVKDLSTKAKAKLKGPTGAAGERGATGATGPAGPQGPAGTSGCRACPGCRASAASRSSPSDRPIPGLGSERQPSTAACPAGKKALVGHGGLHALPRLASLLSQVTRTSETRLQGDRAQPAAARHQDPHPRGRLRDDPELTHPLPDSRVVSDADRDTTVR